jgi:hypothetical protein
MNDTRITTFLADALAAHGTALRHYPDNRFLLAALGEAVGSVGTALMQHAGVDGRQQIPDDWQSVWHNTARVAGLALRIALDGDKTIATPDELPAWPWATTAAEKLAANFRYGKLGGAYDDHPTDPDKLAEVMNGFESPHPAKAISVQQPGGHWQVEVRNGAGGYDIVAIGLTGPDAWEMQRAINAGEEYTGPPPGEQLADKVIKEAVTEPEPARGFCRTVETKPGVWKVERWSGKRWFEIAGGVDRKTADGVAAKRNAEIVTAPTPTVVEEAKRPLCRIIPNLPRPDDEDDAGWSVVVLDHDGVWRRPAFPPLHVTFPGEETARQAVREHDRFQEVCFVNRDAATKGESIQGTVIRELRQKARRYKKALEELKTTVAGMSLTTGGMDQNKILEMIKEALAY